MGEVYKARDQNLGRDIAVKVLPQEDDSTLRSLTRMSRALTGTHRNGDTAV